VMVVNSGERRKRRRTCRKCMTPYTLERPDRSQFLKVPRCISVTEAFG
jgi:hypothetical protein